MQNKTLVEMKAELASKEMTLDTMMRMIATLMYSDTCNSLHDDMIARAVAQQDGEIDVNKLEKTVNTALLTIATRTMADIVIEVWGEDTADAIAQEMDRVGIDGCLAMLKNYIDTYDVA